MNAFFNLLECLISTNIHLLGDVNLIFTFLDFYFMFTENCIRENIQVHNWRTTPHPQYVFANE